MAHSHEQGCPYSFLTNIGKIIKPKYFIEVVLLMFTQFLIINLILQLTNPYLTSKVEVFFDIIDLCWTFFKIFLFKFWRCFFNQSLVIFQQLLHHIFFMTTTAQMKVPNFWIDSSLTNMAIQKMRCLLLKTLPCMSCKFSTLQSLLQLSSPCTLCILFSPSYCNTKVICL